MERSVPTRPLLSTANQEPLAGSCKSTPETMTNQWDTVDEERIHDRGIYKMSLLYDWTKGKEMTNIIPPSIPL